eukprot:2156043-Amphidinium_carterae.1
MLQKGSGSLEQQATQVSGQQYERCTLRVEDLSLAKETRLKAKEASKTPPPSRNDTWKTLLKALPLPAEVDHGDDSEQISTEAPWSAWDASAVQEADSGSQGSLDDDWCEEDEVMIDDWLESEPNDRFETRKRRANEQRQAEPVQVADLKQENAQLRKQLEILTSTLAELKEEIVRMRQERHGGSSEVQGAPHLPDQAAPMDDGEAFVEIFEGRQEAVTYMAASVFHSRKKQAAQEGKSFQLARLHHGSTMQAARRESWGEVSGEGNLCFWRCLSAILKATRHPDQEKSALILKQEVCNWGIMNATKASQQLACTPNGLLNDIRTAQRKGVMANEKCFALAALYFDLKLLIVDEDSSICWGLLPLSQGEDDVRLWPLWCKKQHSWHGHRTLDCSSFPALDALLGADDEAEGANRMSLLAGGRPSWWGAAFALMLPSVQVAGDWGRTLDLARHEEQTKHWKLATVNSTCWNSMCMQLAEWGPDGPDIIFQQEHHQKAEQMPTMQSDARVKGYKAFITPAFATGRGGTTGGTAIMVRRRYGAISVQGLQGLPGRLTAVRIAGITKPAPLLVSLYLPVDAT